MNRALILGSFNRELLIHGESSSADVQFLREALRILDEGGREFWVGDAGTTFRFLALRLSREPGAFLIRGSPRLFSRPYSELQDTLRQLDVEASMTERGFEVRSSGRWPQASSGVIEVRVDNSRSSQFSSAVLLSSLNLPADFELRVDRYQNSVGYLNMTLELMKRVGISFEHKVEGGQLLLRLPPRQRVNPGALQVDADASSGFAVLAAAALAGSCTITNWPQTALQPDEAGFEALRQMGVVCSLGKEGCHCHKPRRLAPIRWSFATTPDLFPVMAILAAFAEGESYFEDFASLEYKESHRLENTRKLLGAAGVQSYFENHGILKIQGRGLHYEPPVFDFDPDHDHRMAMAAGLLKLRQPRIRIHDPEVVGKSFPAFWQILGVES